MFSQNWYRSTNVMLHVCPEMNPILTGSLHDSLLVLEKTKHKIVII